MVFPIVFCISKTPTITWVGSQKLLIKLTTIANVSYPAHDIQKSKELMHVIQEAKVGKTYFSLDFVIILEGLHSLVAFEMESEPAHIDE
jgi:hypothetical protein